jgi:hypothetical protein
VAELSRAANPESSLSSKYWEGFKLRIIDAYADDGVGVPAGVGVGAGVAVGVGVTLGVGVGVGVGDGVGVGAGFAQFKPKQIAVTACNSIPLAACPGSDANVSKNPIPSTVTGELGCRSLIAGYFASMAWRTWVICVSKRPPCAQVGFALSATIVWPLPSSNAM